MVQGIGIYLYLYSTSKLEWVGGKSHASPALPPGKRPDINYTEGWVDLGASLLLLLLFVRAQDICPRCTTACRLIVLL
jgi:hypothetical protein